MPVMHRKEKVRFPTELAILERRGRDRLSIMAEMLDIAKEGTLKTHIMYIANLSFTQLNEMLSLLIDLGLLKLVAKGRKRIYKTTEKGFRYLESYREILNLLPKNSVKYRYVSKLHRMSSALKELKKAIDDTETSIMNLTKCPKCEEEIFADFRFCPYCGNARM